MAQTASMIATEVTGIAKDHFTVQLFGEQHFCYAESYVYTWMRKLCDKYNGGMWRFFKTSNGAMFMAPDSSEIMHLTWAMNWSDERISAGAAGIVATLFALNTLINVGGNEGLIERYYALSEFAADHHESSAIFRLID
ncbi:antirestriction protein [Alcaligenes faecalis]|uniref:antirestriction protein n=1 Tax=Alcaligenes aquatilis TaxID=323284 RepID=UPI002AA87E8C|nr:antirestriction protein [Alcaligenes faecalis]